MAKMNLVFKFKIDGFDYAVFASSDTTFKCYGCKKIGHLIRSCPDKVNKSTVPVDADNAESAVAETSESAAASLEVMNGITANVSLEEPVAGESSAEKSMSDSSLVDEGVVVGPVAAETVVGLSKTVSSAFVEQDRETENEDLRMNDCELNMEVESIFKVPIKRKKKNRHDKVSKQAKKSDGEDETSQVTYVTMVPRVGNETLRPLGDTMGNASSVTRA